MNTHPKRHQLARHLRERISQTDRDARQADQLKKLLDQIEKQRRA